MLAKSSLRVALGPEDDAVGLDVEEALWDRPGSPTVMMTPVGMMYAVSPPDGMPSSFMPSEVRGRIEKRRGGPVGSGRGGSGAAGAGGGEAGGTGATEGMGATAGAGAMAGAGTTAGLGGRVPPGIGKPGSWCARNLAGKGEEQRQRGGHHRPRAGLSRAVVSLGLGSHGRSARCRSLLRRHFLRRHGVPSDLLVARRRPGGWTTRQ